MATELDVTKFTKTSQLSGLQLYFFVLLEQLLKRKKKAIRLTYHKVEVPDTEYLIHSPYYQYLKYARSKGALKGLDYKFIQVIGDEIDLDSVAYRFTDRYADYFNACRQPEQNRVVLDVDRLLQIGVRDDFLFNRNSLEYVILQWLAYFVVEEVLESKPTSLFYTVRGGAGYDVKPLVSLYRVLDILALHNIISIEGLSPSKLASLGELAFTTDRKELGLLRAEGYSAEEKYQFALDHKDHFDVGSVVYLYERNKALTSTTENAVVGVELAIIESIDANSVRLKLGIPSITKEQREYDFKHLDKTVRDEFYFGELQEITLRERDFHWGSLGIDGLMSDKAFTYYEDYFIVALDFKGDGYVTQTDKKGVKRDYSYNQAIYNILESYKIPFNRQKFKKIYL